MTVRYFDTLATEAMGYYDFTIHIRLVHDNPITLSDQVIGSLDKCAQNVYPLSYGGYDTTHSPNKGDNMIGYGFYYFVDDNNMIISGKTQNLTHNDGSNNDGFVMRITPLGFINWLTYVSTKQGIDEYVGNAVVQGSSYVYAHFHNNHGTLTKRSSAIVKLTYEEGKLVWAKQIVFTDIVYSPPVIITRDSGWMIDADPTSSERLFVASLLQFTGKGIHPAITVVKDDGTILYNYFVKP